MEMPRYRCAVEVAQLPEPQEVYIARNDMRPGYNQRVEQNDEFFYDGDRIGAWMEPINDAAIAKAEAAVQAKKRKQVGAVHAAPTEPLKVPRSGLAGSSALPTSHGVRDVMNDERTAPARPAPRRRAATN